MLNRINLMGRITRAPELKETGNGTKVLSFSLACDRDYVSDSGERGVDFIDCVAWRSTAEFIARYFTKGSLICIDGRLQVRKWVDNDGNNRYSTEIVVSNAYFTRGRREDRGAEQRADGIRPYDTYSSGLPPYDASLDALAARYPGTVHIGEGEAL